LANAVNQGFDNDTVVAAGDNDVGEPLVAFDVSEMHEDTGATVGAFDLQETIYLDLAGSNIFGILLGGQAGGGGTVDNVSIENNTVTRTTCDAIEINQSRCWRRQRQQRHG
jgi:hypothetical protein